MCFSFQFFENYLNNLCPHPNDESDISKSHPEHIRTLTPWWSWQSWTRRCGTSQCNHASWEGLREGPPHPLAGGQDNLLLGDTETGLGSWTWAWDPPGLIQVGRCPLLGWNFPRSADVAQCSGLDIRVTQFRLICSDCEVSVSDVSKGGAWWTKIMRAEG